MSHRSWMLALVVGIGGSAWAAGGGAGAAGGAVGGNAGGAGAVAAPGAAGGAQGGAAHGAAGAVTTGPSQGTAAGAAGATTGGPTTTTPTSNIATANGANSLTNAPASTNNNPLPPPPPASLDPLLSSNNTVPPTPAQATAGLPSPPQSPALPSQQGLSATTANELRPSPSLNAAQLTSVQASLAAGGLYRGPIDGNMSGSLRAAVRQFQEISRLPMTGELDAETLSRLSHSAATSGTGTNGTTSTAGNRNASEPFSSTFTGVPGTGTSTPGTATFSTPFQLSSPINTSPATPPGVVIQP